ncbi:MAG: mannose-1-phosphate guanylyltransferase [Candidatus Moranbacteria bacterium]|nr:mannose-1-phosphate guanylyltransferase [Candidatus Moranbacteria bacterium]
MPSIPKKELPHCYIVIMAGGSGTRLWPLSRKAIPKQFQAFTSPQTMIQETFARVAQVIPKENIFVSTTKDYAPLVRKQIPEIAEERLILEPEARNTAPAIALVATMIRAHDPSGIVATIASDHAIENDAEFVATLQAALETVTLNPDQLVTVGINPTRPDTGLGYIKMGREFSLINEKRIFEVDAFKEKPDQKTAEDYVANWQYLWNAGYFIFSAETFATWTETFAPELHAIMSDIGEQKKSGHLDEAILATLYKKTTSEPIEPLIVEKLSPEKRLVIPSSMKWSDVGNWETLYDFLSEKTGTTLVTRHDNTVHVGSKNCFIYGEKRLIATLGIEDLVIIDTDDALFVARLDQAGSDMKKLIEKLKEEKKNSYL